MLVCAKIIFVEYEINIRKKIPNKPMKPIDILHKFILLYLVK